MQSCCRMKMRTWIAASTTRKGNASPYEMRSASDAAHQASAAAATVPATCAMLSSASIRWFSARRLIQASLVIGGGRWGIGSTDLTSLAHQPLDERAPHPRPQQHRRQRRKDERAQLVTECHALRLPPDEAHLARGLRAGAHDLRQDVEGDSPRLEGQQQCDSEQELAPARAAGEHH